MGVISASMVVVYWLLISGTTNRAEKLQLILLIIFLNGVCWFYLGGGTDDGGRWWCGGNSFSSSVEITSCWLIWLKSKQLKLSLQLSPPSFWATVMLSTNLQKMVLMHENILRRMEHWDFIHRIDPYQLKFCREKSIKGAYNVIGISSIAPNMMLFFTSCTKAEGATLQFLQRWSLRPLLVASCIGDVCLCWITPPTTVVKRCPILTTTCRDHRIFLHFLPPHLPELNPVKLLVNLLMQELKYVPLTHHYGYCSDQIVHATTVIMDRFTYQDVYAYHCHCNYITF